MNAFCDNKYVIMDSAIFARFVLKLYILIWRGIVFICIFMKVFVSIFAYSNVYYKII